MRPNCSVPDCERPAKAKGWCQTHYMRWWQTGDVAEHRPLGRYLRTPESRFLERTDRNGPVPAARPGLGRCWLWTGARNSVHGYGVMWLDGRGVLVHRWAYERFVGPVPEGFELDHVCRNKSCVNTAHLEAVTHQENTLRGVRRPHCKHGHEYTRENTAYHRDGSRYCRECDRRRSRAQHLRRKQLKEAVVA